MSPGRPAAPGTPCGPICPGAPFSPLQSHSVRLQTCGGKRKEEHGLSGSGFDVGVGVWDREKEFEIFRAILVWRPVEVHARLTYITALFMLELGRISPRELQNREAFVHQSVAWNQPLPAKDMHDLNEILSIFNFN